MDVEVHDAPRTSRIAREPADGIPTTRTAPTTNRSPSPGREVTARTSSRALARSEGSRPRRRRTARSPLATPVTSPARPEAARRHRKREQRDPTDECEEDRGQRADRPSTWNRSRAYVPSNSGSRPASAMLIPEKPNPMASRGTARFSAEARTETPAGTSPARSGRTAGSHRARRARNRRRREKSVSSHVAGEMSHIEVDVVGGERGHRGGVRVRERERPSGRLRQREDGEQEHRYRKQDSEIARSDARDQLLPKGGGGVLTCTVGEPRVGSEPSPARSRSSPPTGSRSSVAGVVTDPNSGTGGNSCRHTSRWREAGESRTLI